MYLQTLGALTLKGEGLEQQVNQGPQRKTLERLAYVLIEKEVSRESFEHLFLSYADNPSRELRRVFQNINQFFEKKGLEKAVIVESKVLKANLKTDLDLIDEYLENTDLFHVCELYKGAFFEHFDTSHSRDVIKTWALRQRRLVASRLLDALIKKAETFELEALELDLIWPLFQHATSFAQSEGAHLELLEEGAYKKALLYQVFPLLKNTVHPDLADVEREARNLEMTLPEVLLATDRLNTHTQTLDLKPEIIRLPVLLTLIWLGLGAYCVFLSYGFFAASRGSGYHKPTAYFESLPKVLAPFWGMAIGGVIFLMFLFFTRELIKNRSGKWYEKLPLFDLLPAQLSDPFKISCCTLAMLAFYFVPFSAQLQFARTFFGLDAPEANIYKINRRPNGSPEDLDKRYSRVAWPSYCHIELRLTCLIFFEPYPLKSMWERTYVYGQEERGQHMDFYPYIGPYLLLLFEIWLWVVTVKIFLRIMRTNTKVLL